MYTLTLATGSLNMYTHKCTCGYRAGVYIGRGGFLVARIPPFWPEKWVGHTKCRAIMRALLSAGVHKVHNHGY